jgi:hypothetical protein
LGNYRVRRGLLLVLLFNGHSANLKLGRLTIVAVTAPASLIGRAMPLAYYWFILLNAASMLWSDLQPSYCVRA